MSIESEVRSQVRELQNGIRNCKDAKHFTHCLKQACVLLSSSSDKCKGDLNSERRQVFIRNHYANFISFLLDSLSVDLVCDIPEKDLRKYLSELLLKGKEEDAFVALCYTVNSSGPGFKLSKCVSLLEEFLESHKLRDILSEQSALVKDPEMSIMFWREDGRMLQWDTLITEIVSLPDRMASKLKKQNSELFLPRHYIPLLTADLYQTLETVYKNIRLSKDSSLEFVSKLVGKLCLTGYADTFWGILLHHLSDVIREDYIWSRVCERIVTGVPDRCLESVIVPLVRLIPWYGIMGRFLGDSITKKQKIQLILCTKLVFHRYYKDVRVLQNIIGYLATSATRQHLFIKLLLEVIQVWGDSSSLGHMSYEQHFYLTQTIFICLAFINDKQKEENRDEILRLLMPGVQTHIGNSDNKIRVLGMMAAECVTNTVDPDGPKLNFQYEKDSETALLQSLIFRPADPGIEVSLKSEIDRLNLGGAPSLKKETNRVPPPKAEQIPQKSGGESDSELDSDDDLEPYDMSHDTKDTKVKQPKYIRECMEGLVGCDDPDKLEACLIASESLIRADSDGLHEISAEFSKILLHLTDGYGVANFRNLRFNSLVALAVCSPVKVADYLTDQFYDRNYNIRQRLDILEVLGAAAQELSQPAEPSKSSATDPQQSSSKIQEVVGDEVASENWREIVQKRIDSKTRRISKGPSSRAPPPVANRFSPVAGHFMYPLMKNFDRREMTFDLLGEDCMVLGRLMYTLGIVMYAASNIPIVRQMASALLEFIWMLRFHADMSVRQGLLFAVSMVYLAVPPHMLLGDLQQEVLESKNWLEDIVEQDQNTHCKTLAVQALVLLENIIKQEFTVGLEIT